MQIMPGELHEQAVRAAMGLPFWCSYCRSRGQEGLAHSDWEDFFKTCCTMALKEEGIPLYGGSTFGGSMMFACHRGDWIIHGAWLAMYIDLYRSIPKVLVQFQFFAVSYTSGEKPEHHRLELPTPVVIAERVPASRLVEDDSLKQMISEIKNRVVNKAFRGIEEQFRVLDSEMEQKLNEIRDQGSGTFRGPDQGLP